MTTGTLYGTLPLIKQIKQYMIRYLKNTLGDFIAGLCLMFDGLLAVMTFGTYKSRIALKWTLTRVHYNLLIDMQEIENNDYCA